MADVRNIVVMFSNGNGIVAAQPAVQINLAAAIGTERMKPGIRRLAAHGAGLALGKINNLRHRL